MLPGDLRHESGFKFERRVDKAPLDGAEGLGQEQGIAENASNP